MPRVYVTDTVKPIIAKVDEPNFGRTTKKEGAALNLLKQVGDKKSKLNNCFTRYLII